MNLTLRAPNRRSIITRHISVFFPLPGAPMTLEIKSSVWLLVLKARFGIIGFRVYVQVPKVINPGRNLTI